MKLIIVRHGETLANIEKIIQGQLPGELSSNGRHQARLLGERLKTEKLSHIWSSTLKRARETAEEIARFHGLPVQPVEELKERSFGCLEGKSFDDYFQALENSGNPFHLFSPPGGESLVDLEHRVDPLGKKLKAIQGDETILITAHGIINKIILKVLLNKTFDDWHQIRQDNTCVNILETDRQTGRLENILLNCTRHLTNQTEPNLQAGTAHPKSGITHENLSGLSPLYSPPDH